MTTQTEDRVSMSALVDARDRDRLLELARRNDRRVSAEIRRAIAGLLEREPEDEEDV